MFAGTEIHTNKGSIFSEHHKQPRIIVCLLVTAETCLAGVHLVM